MRKGEKIKGYKILQDFEVIGGQSKISFAEKSGKEYFIKEFLSPKFPVDGSPGSSKTKALKRKKCEEFEKHHKSINSKIETKVTIGGNLVFAIDFFRHGTTYFKINEKIDVSSITTSEISKLPLEKKVLICKTVCHSLKILHSLDIVHGDIKPDNVLIKKTKTDNYTSKLIDFDESYFSSKPPINEEEVVGDQVYYSPEMAKYILKIGDVKPSDLTLKSDVFALGVLFTEYLVGKLPTYPSKYNYPWEALINGDTLTTTYPKTLPKSLTVLLDKMLSVDFKNRPTIGEVFNILKKYKTDSSHIEPIKTLKEPTPTAKPKLKGSLLKTRSITSKKESDSTTSKLKGSLLRRKKD